MVVTSLKLIFALVVAGIVLYLAALSFLTRQTPVKAEGERHLQPCPDKPNCVFSAATNPQHTIEALPLLDGNSEANWQRAVAAITQAGGQIVVDDGDYCHAVFTSTLFRFKDDVEMQRLDAEIAIRSASRAGTSDLGKNRQRVERIRELYLTNK